MIVNPFLLTEYKYPADSLVMKVTNLRMPSVFKGRMDTQCFSSLCMIYMKAGAITMPVSIQLKPSLPVLPPMLLLVPGVAGQHCSLTHSYALRYNNSTGPVHNKSNLSRLRAIAGATPQSGNVSNFTYTEGSSISGQRSDEGSDSDENEEEMTNDDSNTVEGETLELLEWPKICIQVSQFACTPVAIQSARDGLLPIGITVEASEELQAQTASARLLSTPLDFTDVEDVRAIVAGALSGNVCPLDGLCRVQRTLASARRLYDQVCGSESAIQQDSSEQEIVFVDPLQTIMLGCDLCSELVASIDHCLDCSFSIVLDRASPKLAEVRKKKKENLKVLEVLLKETAAMIVDAGGMDSPLVTRRRARMCVAVRASHKGLLPGGVTLDVSNSGATFFMEPEAALALNNEEIRLAGEEEAEEIAVLRRLTFLLLDGAGSIADMLKRITSLDLACARAGHAAWLNAVQPVFNNKSRTGFNEGERMYQEGFEESVWMVDIDSVRHPLLLGAALSAPLDTHRYGVIQQKGNARGFPSSRKQHTSTHVEQRDIMFPVAIDIKVQAGVRVVTITGPNTGGKTASLKTLGVSALMAKAGLYLPASGMPQLPWFDSVLADIGDDQSLERSLSTFSGHIRRVCKILEAGTPQSLVLLDEVGGGTDPSEGAALATAVLHSCASLVQLTLATTHSAELRSLKDQDPRFENASVDFDIKTLRPTYRVLWGIAGQSNALDIAASLGLDAGVLKRARELVTTLIPSRLGARVSDLMVPLVKQRDDQRGRAQAAGAALIAVSKLHDELQSESHNLTRREGRLKRLQEESIDLSVSEANAKMEQVLSKFQVPSQKFANDETTLSMRDVQAAIAAIAEEHTPEPREPDTLLFTNGSRTRADKRGVGLSVGDKVVIRRLGKLPATVVELPQGESDYLTVQLGNMKMQVKASETRETGKSVGEAAVNKPVKPTRVKQPEVQAGEAKYEVAVQTTRNTLDLRGKPVDISLRELDLALASRAPLSVLFVVHGIGTGAVKAAVWQVLKKHPYVVKFEHESIMNAGCTIVYIK